MKIIALKVTTTQHLELAESWLVKKESSKMGNQASKWSRRPSKLLRLGYGYGHDTCPSVEFVFQKI